MNSPKQSSETPSVGAVATAQPPTAASKSESAFLKEQAANAKAAFKQTLGEIGSSIGMGASPAKWTEEHPWIMLASASVLGFTSACVAVPSKEQSALKRLKKLEEALRPDKSDNPQEKASPAKPEKKTLASVFVGELIRGASGIVATMLKASKENPAPGMSSADGNGSAAGQASI